jgi:hypothetical protein
MIGSSNLIIGRGTANFLLPNGTKMTIIEALYAPKANRTLLSFKDIRSNGYHIETHCENGNEYMYITSNEYGRKRILEKLMCQNSGLYLTTIRVIESYYVINNGILNNDTYRLWHDRLGHPGRDMMIRVLKNTHGHPFFRMKGKMKQLTESTKLQQLTSEAKEATTSSQYASLNTPNFCKACSLAKTGSRPSYAKDTKQNIPFLQRIQGDICGPIHPECGPFKYFMVLVDASTRWTHVALLSTRNAAFAKLLAQIIRLRAHHPDYPIKSIRLDNAGEFTSQAFDDYCMSIGIDVEHPVPHVHTQNGLAEATIKRIQMIARALVMRTNLPTSAWGYAILHAALLIRFRPTASQPFSAYQLVTGYEPDISHLRIFGCAVYVPIAPPQRTKMGPQRRLSIYVGYESPTIIRYLEPLTSDLFTARFADCHFDETVFPSLGGDRKNEFPRERQELSWNVPTLSHFDPRTSQCESEVKRIINLQNVADSIPDAFTDIAKVTRSHIPAANVPARLEVPKQGHNTVGKSVATTHSGSVVEAVAPKRKRGRPLGSVDTRPRKKKESTAQSDPFIINTENPSHEIVSDYSYVHESLLEDAPKSILIPENKEISMNYENVHELMERSSILIDDIFAYTVAHEIIEHDDIEPRSVEECQQRADWPKWKEAIQEELDSLAKRQVFGPVVLTPPSVKPVGHKWVFVRKRNENNEVIRYKARLVAQGFSQRPGIDYEETYSPVMDVITFRYLISLVVSEGLEMQLMDVVTAYLYGDLDSEIYMKVPNGLTLPDSSKPRSAYAIKLKRSLYGLKQSGRMWYTRLSEYLIKRGYKNDELCPCVFIKKTSSGFSIIAVYVDDMNIIGTLDEIRDTASYLKSEFEMKDLGKTRFCLGIELEHRACGILIHQSAYIQKMLRRFNMDKAHPASTPMIGRSLDIRKDPFRPKDDDEEVLGAEIPYLSAIGALLYLAQCTRPDIAFSVNLLARFSSAPTQRHWNGIKNIFRYLKGTTDMGLFFPYKEKNGATIPINNENVTPYIETPNNILVGFADAGYLSDPHKCRSQTGYVFTIGNTAISWKSTKQTLVATSSNHSEIIALHEAVRECIWLRSVITHIRGASGLSSTTDNPTCIYEDNAACIEQMKVGYIKGDNTKHISPKFFYNQQQQTLLKIQVNQVRSEENVADLFTKSLPKATFEKHVESIGMRRLSKLP